MYFARYLPLVRQLLFVSTYILAFAYRATGTGGNCQQPVPPAPPNGGCVSSSLPDNIVEAVKRSVLHVTLNKTVSSDEAASFEIKLTRILCCDVAVSIVNYVDDCRFNNEDSNNHIKCENVINHDGGKHRKCTFSNLSTLSNNPTKIQFLLLVSHEDVVAYFTCISPSYLFIEEKPSEVFVLDHTIDPCNGISFVFSPFPSDTHLVCKLHDYEKSAAPLYHNRSCDNDTLIPTEVFHNHTGIYTLITTSEKTVAKGETTHFKIELGKEAIKVNIKDLSLHVIGNEFFAFIMLEVNHTCPLTVPNFVYPVSNCFEYVKIKQLIKNLDSNNVILQHLVKTGNNLCTLRIEDSGGNIIHYNETFSTFFTQNVSLVKGPGYTYSILCESVSVRKNVGIKGCRINYTRIQNESDSVGTPSTEIAEMSDSRAGIIDFSGPGAYRIDVYDLGNNDNPAIRTSVIIPQSSMGQSSSLLPTVTTEHSEEGGTSKGSAIAIALLATICIVLFILVILLVALRVYERRKSINDTNEDDDIAPQNDEFSSDTSTSNAMYEPGIPEQDNNGLPRSTVETGELTQQQMTDVTNDAETTTAFMDVEQAHGPDAAGGEQVMTPSTGNNNQVTEVRENDKDGQYITQSSVTQPNNQPTEYGGNRNAYKQGNAVSSSVSVTDPNAGLLAHQR